jgi:hypothetical protein
MDRLGWIPMVRFAQAIRRRLPREPEKPAADPEDDLPTIEHAVNVLRQNQRMSQAVCRSYQIECLFFLQPHATYSYEKSLYRRSLPESFMREGAVVQPVFQKLQEAGGRIYLGDLFRLWGSGRKAIVDDVHYSPGFNRFLAEHAARHVNLPNLVARAGGDGLSESTGSARTPP